MDQPAKDSFRQMATATRMPWKEAARDDVILQHKAVQDERSGSGTPTGFGLERRLPRRAETMWEQLASSPQLPPAASAAQFLRIPYAGNAMLLRHLPGQALHIEAVGEALQAITQLRCGAYAGGREHVAALGQQMLELAQVALARGAPMRMESERLSQRPSAGRPHLLLRAVALPFAPDDRGEQLCVVVCSWRKLLSAEETAALHRELAAAMNWMHSQRPGD